MACWRGTLVLITVLCYLHIVPTLSDICTWSSWSECTECVVTQQRYKKDPQEHPNAMDCFGEETNQKRYCKKDCVRDFNWWRDHNTEGLSKETQIPWPRLKNAFEKTEDLEFFCDRTSDITWLEILQIPEFEFSNISKHITEQTWNALAQQYVVAILNTGAGARTGKSEARAISKSRDLLVLCGGSDDVEADQVETLYDVLKSWNTGHSDTPACISCSMESQELPPDDDLMSNQQSASDYSSASDNSDFDRLHADRATVATDESFDDSTNGNKIPAAANHGTFYFSSSAAIILVVAIIGVPMLILGAIIGLPVLLNTIIKVRSQSVNSQFPPPDVEESPHAKKARHSRLDAHAIDEDLDPITLSDTLPKTHTTTATTMTSTHSTTKFVPTVPTLRLETVDVQVTEDELDELVL